MRKVNHLPESVYESPNDDYTIPDDVMCTTVSTAKERGQAIRSNESRIIITGSLGDVVIKIEEIRPLAWLVATGAVGSISVLTVLCSAAAACGGIGTLHALRKYQAKREDHHVVLTMR